MYTLACAIVILVLAPASIRIVGRSLYGALMLVGVVVLILVPPAIYLLDLLDEHISVRLRNHIRRAPGLAYVEEARWSDRHTTEEEAYIREIADNAWCDECKRCHAHVYKL